MNLEVIRHRPLTSEEFRVALEPKKRVQTPDGELDVDWLFKRTLIHIFNDK